LGKVDLLTPSHPGSVFLQGSGQPSSRIFKEMIKEALAGVSGRKPRVALSLAALANSIGAVRKFLGWFTARTFGDAEVERFSVAGEKDAMDPDDAYAIVQRADLIYLTGGDPVLGARLLNDSGAAEWLRQARARGAHLAGGSAGAIMLGAWWADWPEEPDGRPFDGGVLVPCTGVVPDLVVDTHAEENDWEELLLVKGMLAAAGHSPRLRGIPTDGGLIVGPDDGLRSVGDPAFEPK
jgi:cyanophycinase-like exopeptidase